MVFIETDTQELNNINPHIFIFTITCLWSHFFCYYI